MIFKIIGGKAVRYDSGGTEKIDDLTVDFSQAESRDNITPTDTMKTILGKIMKWFSDLSAGAASSLLGQNLTAGKVLVSDDGGKVAASVVDASKVGVLSGVTGDLQEQINSLNSACELTNLRINGKPLYNVNDFFDNSPTGLSYFVTTSSFAESDRPDANYRWGSGTGMLLKRSNDEGNIMIFEYGTNRCAIGCVVNGAFTGWTIK